MCIQKWRDRRRLDEEIQRELMELMHNDKTLSKEQYEELKSIIYYGAYTYLHSVFKCYKEAGLFIKFLKTSDNPQIIYNRIKDYVLHSNHQPKSLY